MSKETLMITEISNRQLEIIEAAGRILTRSGVSGLTIKNLANEMKFSEAAIYRHFKSKEEIIIAMLDYLAENMDQRLTQALTQGESPVDKFKILFQDQFNFFSKNPHFVVAVFSEGLMEASAGINRSILKIMQVKTKHLTSVINKGQQNGDFIKTVSIDELVHIAMGAFRLLMFQWRVANFGFNVQETGENLIGSVLNLIQHQER